MMDNGYPQTTEVKLLKGFIHTESYELNGQNILVPRVRIKNGKAVLNKENALEEGKDSASSQIAQEFAQYKGANIYDFGKFMTGLKEKNELN